MKLARKQAVTLQKQWPRKRSVYRGTSAKRHDGGFFQERRLILAARTVSTLSLLLRGLPQPVYIAFDGL